MIGVQASSAMRAIASRIVFVTATAREEAAAARQTATALWEKNAESARTTIRAVTPIARTVARASRSRLAAPLPEPAEPLRSRVATITGAQVDVLTVTIWKCRPRCLV